MIEMKCRGHVDVQGCWPLRLLIQMIQHGATLWCWPVVEDARSDAHRLLPENGDGHEADLDGCVACKLEADNFGRSEWWLLLE